MKIGRNDACPCGSGKKYKKCCLDKDRAATNNNTPQCICPKCGGKMKAVGNFKAPLMTILRKPKGTEFNKEINDLFLQGEILYHENEANAFDYYFKVTNYLISYALEHDINSLDELDKCGIIEEFVSNIFTDFEMIIDNANDKLEMALDYLNKFMKTFKLDNSRYENSLRTKTRALFKLGRYDEGEEIMVNYIKDNPKSAFAYVELIDDFIMIKNYKKAKEYYDLGMAINDLKDKDVIEERMGKWYEEV